MTLTAERRHALAPATIQTLIRRATGQEIADAIPWWNDTPLSQAEILDLVAAVRTARIAVSWPGDDAILRDHAVGLLPDPIPEPWQRTLAEVDAALDAATTTLEAQQ